MRAYLTRRYRFSASHRLNATGLSETENKSAFGKCNNPHGHGHNYSVEVTFGGEIDGATGMVTNLGDLDAFAREHLLERFGHTNLNTLAEFAEVVPTTENLSVELWKIFATYLHASLTRVHVEETSNNAFDYMGGRNGSK